MELLPCELLYYICLQAPLPTLLRLKQVNQILYNICLDDYFWQQKTINEYLVINK